MAKICCCFPEPQKVLCCLPLRCGSHLIGLFQWVGVAAGLTLLATHYNSTVTLNHWLEAPLMLLVAYTLPAFAWFASVFAEEKSGAKKCFAILYFLCHFAVEVYAFTMPLVYLHSYFGVPSHTVTLNKRQFPVGWYLIINSAVFFVMMIFTSYISCCLYSYSRQVSQSGMSEEAKARLLEERTIYYNEPKKSPAKPVSSSQRNVPNSMY